MSNLRIICIKLLLLLSGALLDKYVISHYKNLFPDELFKVDQVLSQDKMAYGAVINDSNLNDCFKEVLKYDRFIVYNFIRSELQRTMRVRLYYTLIHVENLHSEFLYWSLGRT